MNRFLLVALISVAPLVAVSTQFWRSAGYQDLSRGRLSGLSLGEDGRLAVAPAMREVFHTDQALIWTMAADTAGDLYLASGHRGMIFRLTPAMLRQAAAGTVIPPASALLYTAPESEIFALAMGPDGALYAGSSPDGKIYRITANGQSSVYFDPQSKYIWALAFSGANLYVATGENGEIYKVTAAGEGKKFLDTQQRQVMSLAVNDAGDLYAGTEPGGLIYRVQASGKAFVVYHSDLAEIHALQVAANGDLYAAAQGTSNRLRLPPPAPAGARPAVARPAGSVTVTVQGDAGQTLEAAGAGAAGAAAAEEAGPAPLVLSDTSDLAAPSGNTLSAVYRVLADGTVDTTWSSRTENADDVLPSAQGLLIATDDDGRIYDLGHGAGGEATVLAQTRQEETTKLLRVGDVVYATTRDFGNLYRLDTRPAAEGSFESPVRDTGSISRWGDIQWTAEGVGATGGKGAVEIATRSGNSARPDFTWSDWSAPCREGQRISSPSARYIQWKATLHSQADQSPQLDGVVIPYLPANQAPVFSDVRVQAAGAGEDELGPAAAARGIRLSWTARDADGDALRYDVLFQAQGATQWVPLRMGLTQTALNITSQMLPDGVYQFKVVASDAAANPVGEGKSVDIVSAPATLDTAPPVVRAEAAAGPAPAPGVAVAHFTVSDPGSSLNTAEFALDGGDWQALLADDGIVDAPRQTFTVRATGLTPGEHMLMLRVGDDAGNAGSGKAVIVVH